MRNTPPALLTHMGQAVSTMNNWVKIERHDGAVQGFTDADSAFDIDGVTFKPTGGFSASAHRQAAGLAPDNMDLRGIIDSADITAEDIRAGRYRGARVWIFQANRKDLAAGKHKLDYGRIGQVVHDDQIRFVVQFNSLATLLGQTIGHRYGTRCRAKLGDADCGVVLDPPVRPADTVVAVGEVYKASVYDERRYIVTAGGTTDTAEPTWDTTIGNTTTEAGGVEYVAAESFTKQGTVTAASADNQSFVDTGRTEAADWFRFGTMTWLTGANAGLSVDIKSYAADGTFALVFPMPFDIAPGDTFTAHRGCNHYLKMPGDTWGSPYTGDCRVVFDNVARFRGEPDIPTADEQVRGPQ